MAMYYCEGCDRMIDDDWHPMNDEGICPECEAENLDDSKRAESIFSDNQLRDLTDLLNGVEIDG